MGAVDLDAVDSSEDWVQVGRELKQADPKRYLELLILAERIVLAHEDPMHSDLRAPSFVVIASQRPKGSA